VLVRFFGDMCFALTAFCMEGWAQLKYVLSELFGVMNVPFLDRVHVLLHTLSSAFKILLSLLQFVKTHCLIVSILSPQVQLDKYNVCAVVTSALQRCVYCVFFVPFMLCVCKEFAL